MYHIQIKKIGFIILYNKLYAGYVNRNMKFKNLLIGEVIDTNISDKDFLFYKEKKLRHDTFRRRIKNTAKSKVEQVCISYIWKQIDYIFAGKLDGKEIEVSLSQEIVSDSDYIKNVFHNDDAKKYNYNKCVNMVEARDSFQTQKLFFYDKNTDEVVVNCESRAAIEKLNEVMTEQFDMFYGTDNDYLSL